VINDPAARTLVVRLSENAGGHARLLWRQGHQALLSAEESGWRTGARTVWAGAPGSGRIAFAVPVTAERCGSTSSRASRLYRRLVSKPGLTATVVLDRETSRILNVRFHHRS
jgi:hypothetical protein